MIIDLTQTFSPHMPVYPGDAAPELKQVSEISKDGTTDHRLHTGMHVGTHIDAPLHMIEGGKKISDFPADKFLGKGVLVDARGKEKIEVELLQGIIIEEGDIVLVLTGLGSQFREPHYYEKYPSMTEAFATRLVEKKIKVVGMDMPSPDYPPFLSHKILLGNEVLIIENLTNLELLAGKSFEVTALPIKLETDAAPARVIAKII